MERVQAHTSKPPSCELTQCGRTEWEDIGAIQDQESEEKKRHLNTVREKKEWG